MHRFFVLEKFDTGMSVNITGDDYNHLKNALRIKEGEELEICDGYENVYLAKLYEYQNTSAKIEILLKIPVNNEPVCKITLYAALLKGDKFDTVIQKCIECGADMIQPMVTCNTVVEVTDKKEARKVERWNRISHMASMQSKRGKIVRVCEPKTLDACTKQFSHDSITLVCYEYEESYSIKAALHEAVTHSVKNINIMIGPEGGFTEKEIGLLKESGAYAVTLGKRILRAETASVAAVFYCTCEYEL
ncbi:MAG: RsmE family RNA methyltransferase [Clostridia bacterium]|jgi:16S rRNA (uracil1498-N3)-methyltransferase